MLFGEDLKSTIAIIVSGVALIGSIVASVVSFLVARRSNYLNTVTVERSKWIDKLRTNISQLIAQAHSLDVQLYRDQEFLASTEYEVATREIVATLALVRLQLNPDGEIDGNVLSLLNAIRKHVGEQDYGNLERVFVRHVQWLLKEEWEKVKYEARGWFGRLWALYRRCRRMAAYDQFCKDDGSITEWL